MAEVIRYVDPDVDGGLGDGTSWANAYSSLFDWEAAEAVNLVTAGNWMHVYCRSSGGTADTTPLVISGWTTGADNYILIEAASTDRASASSFDTSKYRLQNNGSGGYILDIRENYVKLDGLQIYLDATTAAAQGIYFQVIDADNYLTISNCRILATGSNTRNGIVTADAQIVGNIWNCIIVNCTNGIFGDLHTTLGIYNTVCYGCVDGMEFDTAATVKNCVCFANSGEDFNDDSGAATIDYNASDDNTGTNNVAESGGGAAWPSDFTAAGTGNFTLVTGSNLIGAGVVDPGSGLFSDDIEGTARGAAWDLGAFEYVAAAGGTTIPAKMMYYARIRRTSGD